MAVRERDEKREQKTREVADRYARRLGRLKAAGHPLLCSWDRWPDVRAGHILGLSARPVGGPDAAGFFDKRLADAMGKACLSPQGTDGTDGQENIAQTA